MPEALVCPKCSAPLQYPNDGGNAAKCPYCQTTVLLDQTGGGKGIPEDYRALIAKAMQAAQASGHSGQLNAIEAIKFYRQVSGVGLAEAKKVIDSAGPLQVGGFSGGRVRQQPGANVGKMVGVVGAVIGVVVAGIAVFFAVTVHHAVNRAVIGANTFVPKAMGGLPGIVGGTPAEAGFATMNMEFGSSGVGAGHFDDARSIAMDNQGHIYVGEYSNGRVQVFDAAGKYLSEFSLGKGSYLQNLIADRKGVVYAVASSHIYRFTGASGVAMTEMDNGAGGEQQPKDYEDACLAAGGVMYAISSAAGDEAEIVKLDTNTGKIVSSFDTSKAVGESLDFFRIVATTTGEIYALDREKGAFKFSADGRYINRFGGGKTAGVSPLEMPPAQLFSPENIAIDGKGRIYISDAGSCIKVYDQDGNYLNKFGGNEVAFGIVIDDQDQIYACLRNRHTVRKYVVSGKK